MLIEVEKELPYDRENLRDTKLKGYLGDQTTWVQSSLVKGKKSV